MDKKDLAGKKVLVFGSGISGIGSTGLLEKVNALPVIYDGNRKLTPADVMAKLPAESKAQVVIGCLPDEVLETVDLAVLSPGVPVDIPDVVRIKEKNIPVWGEIELAYQCSRGDVLAVTGTNGKTTTTTLVGEIMKYHVEKGSDPFNDQSFVVGNIGTPYTEAALMTTENSVAVAEISSFQLETICDFHPKVSAITNITPDHLDRHHTMEEYIRVKESIISRQGSGDYIVLNYEDPELRAFGERLIAKRASGRPEVFFFSSARILNEGICINGDVIEIRRGGEVIRVLQLKELKLPGTHNYENVMTAVAMTYAYGVPLDEIRHVVRRFTAVEHRIEYVRTLHGVEYYNDSKGTNPDAAIKAIQAMTGPTYLIGGGYNKHNTYDEWIEAFDGKVRSLVLLGETAEAIAECAKQHDFRQFVFVDTLEEAVRYCYEHAKEGEKVLLSPACASWDMFKDFEQRGELFKEYVRNLEG